MSVGTFGIIEQIRNTATNAPNITTTQQTSTTNNQALTESSASKAVTDFYDKYVKLDPPGNPPTQEAFLNQYGTDKLLAYFKDNQNGVDPIVCAQALPNSIKVTNSTVSQKTATVAVDEMFGTDKVSVTATVIDQNGPKIDTLKCSVPLPSGGNGGP